MKKKCISTPARMTVTQAQSFDSSTHTEWAMKIDSTLNSYATIPLPSQPNHSTHNLSSATTTVHVSHSNMPAPLVFSLPLSFHHNMMSTSHTGPSYIASLNQQFLEE